MTPDYTIGEDDTHSPFDDDKPTVYVGWRGCPVRYSMSLGIKCLVDHRLCKLDKCPYLEIGIIIKSPRRTR